MFVHKKTMGVLDRVWSGEYRRTADGGRVPVDRPAAREDLIAAGQDLADWWEIPGASPLGKKLRLYAPWVEPVTDEAGQLLDVRLLPLAPEGEDLAAREALAQEEAARRGYRQKSRVRPRNLMAFLRQQKAPAPGE